MSEGRNILHHITISIRFIPDVIILINYRTRTTDQSPQATWKCVCRAKVKCEKDPKDLAAVHHFIMMKKVLLLTLFWGHIVFFVMLSIRAWASIDLEIY